MTHFADLTGDGLADLVTPGDGELRLCPNTGAFPDRPWDGAVSLGRTTGADLSGMRFADLDGDGRADLVTLGADGSVTARRNTRDLARPWDTPVLIATVEQGAVHLAQLTD